MAMAEPPEKITPPNEVLFFPVSLSQLAARVVTGNNISQDRLPEELRELCSTVRKLNSNGRFIAKDRSCAIEEIQGAIKIGNFGDFPEAICEPQKTPGPMFQTDLIQQARSVMSFLRDDYLYRNSMLDSLPLIAHVIEKRYLKFLKIQASVYPQRLQPPKDVAMVWFCHMLQSDTYERFIKGYVILSIISDVYFLISFLNWNFVGIRGCFSNFVDVFSMILFMVQLRRRPAGGSRALMCARSAIRSM